MAPTLSSLALNERTAICERLTVQLLLEEVAEGVNDERVDVVTPEESEGPYDSLELLGDAVTQEPSNENMDYKTNHKSKGIVPGYSRVPHLG